MTVQDNYKLESYITNGSITSFDFSFKVLEKSNIIVNVEDTEGNITQKQQQTDDEVVLNTDFTGTVIFKEAPIKDYKIYIQRIVDLEQEARYETSSGFQAEVIEKSFDKLTMINQQQQTEIDTCLKVNQFEDVKISNYAETPIENKGIMWAKNEDGSFYLKNTQENPDTVYNEIVKNENVIAIGTNLITDNTIGTCANNINIINTTVENINDINSCGKNIENINFIANNILDIKDKANRDLSNLDDAGKQLFNNKADKNGSNITETFFTGATLTTDTVDYVVESGSNANGFYRKYKSGLIEQWGTLTINSDYYTLTLPTPMTTNTYNFSGPSKVSNMPYWATTNVCVDNKTTTNVFLFRYGDGANLVLDWRIIGF